MTQLFNLTEIRHVQHSNTATILLYNKRKDIKFINQNFLQDSKNVISKRFDDRIKQNHFRTCRITIKYAITLMYTISSGKENNTINTVCILVQHIRISGGLNSIILRINVVR